MNKQQKGLNNFDDCGAGVSTILFSIAKNFRALSSGKIK